MLFAPHQLHGGVPLDGVAAGALVGVALPVVVLPHRDKVTARLESYDVAGGRTGVDHLADPSRRADLAVRQRAATSITRGGDPDLLAAR